MNAMNPCVPTVVDNHMTFQGQLEIRSRTRLTRVVQSSTSVPKQLIIIIATGRMSDN